MKFWFGLGLSLILTACSVISTNTDLEDVLEPKTNDVVESVEVTLEDLGPAPEIENEVWLNVDAPLRLADLRGSVVLLDMWTFG